MKVKVKRINKSIPLPRYQTEGSVGCDLYVREETKVAPHAIAFIPGNVIIEIPPGYMGILASRSSTPLKKGLLTPHGFGVIDQDFCGDDDEIKVEVYNFTDTEVVCKKGERMGQIIFVPIEIAEWEEVDSMKHNDKRGGFGSTGE